LSHTDGEVPAGAEPLKALEGRWSFGRIIPCAGGHRNALGKARHRIERLTGQLYRATFSCKLKGPGPGDALTGSAVGMCGGLRKLMGPVVTYSCQNPCGVNADRRGGWPACGMAYQWPVGLNEEPRMSPTSAIATGEASMSALALGGRPEFGFKGAALNNCTHRANRQPGGGHGQPRRSTLELPLAKIGRRQGAVRCKEP